MKFVCYALLFTILGLCIGYFIFGQINGKYVEPILFIKNSENMIDRIYNTVTGVEKAREKILITGSIGLSLGIILGTIKLIIERSRK